MVGEATNGQESVHGVAEYRPDAVLMDLEMPVMDGVQATQLIKSNWPEVAVIVLTMSPAHHVAALATGADAFISKGSPPEQLLATLRSICTGGAE